MIFYDVFFCEFDYYSAVFQSKNAAGSICQAFEQLQEQQDNYNLIIINWLSSYKQADVT